MGSLPCVTRVGISWIRHSGHHIGSQVRLDLRILCDLCINLLRNSLDVADHLAEAVVGGLGIPGGLTSTLPGRITRRIAIVVTALLSLLLLGLLLLRLLLLGLLLFRLLLLGLLLIRLL